MRKKIFLISVVVLALLSFSTLVGTRIINENLRLNHTPAMVVTDSLLAKDINRNVRAISVNDLKTQIDAGVSSVFGRTGDITALQGDYDSFFYTKTESDNKYLTPTGNGSGLINVNAITLDGLDNTQFIRSDVNDVKLGELAFGDSSISMSTVAFRKGDGASSDLNYNGSYLRHRRGGGGTFSGWQWSNFDDVRFTMGTNGDFTAHNKLIGSELKVGNTQDNQVNSGAINFLENKSTIFGASGSNGIRFSYKGDNDTFYLEGGTGTSINEIFRVHRDSGNFIFSRNVEAPSFIKSGATSDDVLLGDGSTTSLSGISGGGLPAGFYEEGTFTPSLVGGSYTFTSNDARYIRIGNQVTVSLNLTNINGTATSSNNFGISGLIYPVTVGGTDVGNISTFSGSNKTNASISPIKSLGNSNILFAADKDNSPVLNTVNFTNGVIRLTITYTTNVYTP